MSYPGDQGSNPDETPGAGATGGDAAPPIEQSAGSRPDPAYQTPPVDYPELPPPYSVYPVYPPYPGYPAYGPAPAAIPGTNGKAIASIVCGAASVPLCLCYLPALAAIVLGVVALLEVRRTGQAGRGPAIGGIVLGLVSTLIGLTPGLIDWSVG